MIMRQVGTFLVVLIWIAVVSPEPGFVDTTSLNNIANVSYAENSNLSGLASIFSPRMDFDQWKPLTGRGDPLRNDPTYDYEPPVLERVHYWADEPRLEREHYPERKSEVLMLGVSSRKPSVSPRQPPPRRHHRPPPPKYEEYTYKLNDHYPMTILVPPPPPPPGHKPSLFILPDDKQPLPSSNQIKFTEPPKLVRDTTPFPERITSLYSLQESNLIYQSSTTTQNRNQENQTKSIIPTNTVSSDYAGWGPTTPLDANDAVNDTHNLIFNEHFDFLTKQPYSFYKPMLSEAPPPPRVTPNPLLLPTFIPTALPPTSISQATTTHSSTQTTWPTEQSTTDDPRHTQYDYDEDTTTDKQFITLLHSTPTSHTKSKPEVSIFDMLTPMMTMPLVNGPERPEDNLYAHASENLHVYKDNPVEDGTTLETMQTMQPPPVTKSTDITTTAHKHPILMNAHSVQRKKPVNTITHDPYLHMRFTTPMPTIATSVHAHQSTRSTTEPPTVPMYLIIQGHSKVKTYGSKPKPAEDNDTINNEIPKPNETNEVKHLHPIKDKHINKFEKIESRKSRAQNLKSLIDEGRGSIEIQDTNVGIKYDVSDGSDVPIEIYRKGIVDSDENDYSSLRNRIKEKREKRQIDFEGILPLEDTLDEFVYDFLKGRRNETGVTGLLAQAVTGNDAGLDGIEEEDDDDDDENEDR